MRSDAIRRRRLELGLARRDVAREVALSEGAIARVERGGDADDWSLRQVRRLARVLGMTVAELLEAEQPQLLEVEDAEVARLTAVLAHSERLTSIRALAEALGWTLSHVRDVLAVLDKRSPALGLRVQRLRGQVALRPRSCEADLGPLLHREMAGVGMSRTHARTLHGVFTQSFDEQRADANQRISLAALLGADLVEDQPDGPRLAEAVAFGLQVERRGDAYGTGDD